MVAWAGADCFIQTQERFPDEPGYEDAWDEALAWLHACGPGVDLQIGDQNPSPSSDPADMPDGADPLAAVEGVLLGDEGRPDEVAGFQAGSEAPHRAEDGSAAADVSEAGRAGTGARNNAEIAAAAAPRLALRTPPVLAAPGSRGSGVGAGGGQAGGRRMLAAHTQELARQQRRLEAHAAAAWGRMGVAAC